MSATDNLRRLNDRSGVSYKKIETVPPMEKMASYLRMQAENYTHKPWRAAAVSRIFRRVCRFVRLRFASTRPRRSRRRRRGNRRYSRLETCATAACRHSEWRAEK